MKHYTTKEGENFFKNDFPLEIWVDNYQDSNETIENYIIRQTETIYKNESENLKLDLKNALFNKRICFGGRVGANIGTSLKNVHAFNCYSAQRSTKPFDSIKNIYVDLLNGAEILKTEGGIGFNFNHLRPKGTFIKGIGSTTPGVVDFMELYDTSAKIITKGNSGEKFQTQTKSNLKKKTRKGAQMSMLSCVHPDIIDYIEAKQIPNVLTKFNMSVAITDEFMNCVINDEDWNLWFPDIHFEKYDEEWNGNFEEWKDKEYPIVVYKTIKAKELWNLIIKNSYNRNEPGLYFIDNANRYNNLIYHQKIVCTNPCQPAFATILTPTGIKTLGEINIGDLIWSGKQWTKVINKWFTGNKQVNSYNTSIGSFIGTENHRVVQNGKKIEVKDATAIDKCFLSGENSIESSPFIIETIDNLGLHDVFDITVDADEHTYWTDGLLVSNCGEISMMSDAGVYEHDGILYEHLGDICNLGTINLVKYWDGKGFDFVLLKHDIYLLVRALDNLIDISSYPLEGLKNAAKLRRKIGCGVMGYGSLLYMMKIKYGSLEAYNFTKELSVLYANTAYQASSYLSKEKGTFILYDDKIFDNGYIKNSNILTEETISIIKEYGLRNSQLLTAAPNGNTSIIMDLVSGGIEPVFEKEYIRWTNVSHKIQDELKDKHYPDFQKNEWFETDDFKFIKKGDEQLLESTDGCYQIDKNRGLIKRVICEDYGWTWVKQNFSKEEIEQCETANIFVTAMQLTVEEHLNPFTLWSTAIDNSISKTINLKNDYPIDAFSDLYIKLWKNGVRGCTTYREGTMSAVLETRKEADKTKKQIKNEHKEFLNIWKGHEGNKIFEEVSLPDEYPCKGVILKTEGKKFYLHVAFKDKEKTKPFAIFVHTNNRESDIITYSALDILEKLAAVEGIPQELIDKNKQKCGGQNNINKLARTISLLLRHNVKIALIVKSIDNIEEIVPVSSFIFRLKKFLMTYIDELDTNGMECPECNEKVIFMEGCIRCSQCGWSKC